jgi:hypothetical protein
MSVKMAEAEKDRRKAVMFQFRNWLKKQGRNQHWAADELIIYHGYLSNLLTGKQIPSVRIVESAQRLMGTYSPPGSTKAANAAPPAPTTIVEKTWKTSVKPAPRKTVKKSSRALQRKERPSPIAWMFHKQRLSAESAKVVGDIVVSYVENHPGLDADELVKAVRGLSQGFASPTP